ncbi:hypothetical protein [Luteimonas sp. R10]|uniref:hypothetical protein n=1 Tax=Luteimonas sp. R10 TaxID=3108176 RepID=UPI00309004FC|nr:hypothetical protein U3649_16390 [Luteimonas sp. R10]
MRTRPRFPAAFVFAAALSVSACGGGEQEAADARGTGQPEVLPAPAQPAGGITGMPDAPGPGQVPLGGEPPPPEPWLAPDGNFGLPPLEDEPEAGLSAEDADAAPDDAQTGAGEPTVEDAVAVIGDYYAAIDEGGYARAYRLWSNDGEASGQTEERFAAGFARTEDVAVQVGKPGAVEGAAGSRYVRIPVAVTARHDDGAVHRYAGHYVLRRAVVDGASAEQRTWRIASAELREERL